MKNSITVNSCKGKKMKNLFLFAALVTTLSGTAEALPAFIEAPLFTTASPVVSTAGLAQCGKRGTDAGLACGMGLTAAPMSTTSVLALVALREEIAEVEPDMNEYLAGGSMTYALESMVEVARNQNDELAAMSDRDIIRIFIDVVKIP